MESSTSGRGRIALFGAIAIVIVIAVTALVISFVVRSGGTTSSTSSAPPNPFAGHSLYVNPDSLAAKQAASASGTDLATDDLLAKTPTAIWLTPEQHPTAEVGSVVSDIETAAAKAGALPVLVVYGIPNRDCSSGLSGGGATVADYPKWVAQIAAGIGDQQTIVILEPDSLALTPQCGNQDERFAEIKKDISLLSASNVSIYLDGGHSTWLPASQMAPLLQQAGISKVRGFASNVSNYNSTESELAYDNQVSQLTGGAHYVVDTSRNGNGGNGEWCNPSGRKIGSVPGAVDNGSAQDAGLWIKAPGESDGTCNGGPAAGQWWQQAATALVSG